MGRNKHLFIILLLLAIFSFIPSVYADDDNDKIHFLKTGSSDAILIESNGHYGLVDTSNPSDSNDEFYKALNGLTVKNYLSNVLGNKKLDFVLLTHNHSDHVGGVPDIVNFIDNNTIVFYKKYHTIESEEPNWHNSHYYDVAINALNNTGCVMFELSEGISDTKLDSINSMNSNVDDIKFNEGEFSFNTKNIDDNISFSWSSFDINLYNLYHLSDDVENLNSVIMLLTKGDKKVALTGDIETGIVNNTLSSSLGVENQIANIIGSVDVLKAAHHSYDTSNSLYMMKKFDPKYFIITNSYAETLRESIQFMISYLNDKGVEVYETGYSDGAIVVDLSGDNISINNYSFSANLVGTASKITGNFTDGWKSANNNSSKDKAWMYIKDGVSLKGWNELTYNNKTSNYYFDDYGVMYTGLLKEDKYTYYFNPSTNSDKGIYMGELLIGWQFIDNNWYYFNDSSSGYPTGAMLKGWQYLTYKNTNFWYYFVQSNDDYEGYSEGQMLIGRHQVVKNGTKSYFYFCEETDNPSGYYKGTMISNMSYLGYDYDKDGRELSNKVDAKVDEDKAQEKVTNQTTTEKKEDNKVVEIINVPNLFASSKLVYPIVGIILVISGITISFYTFKFNKQ